MISILPLNSLGYDDSWVVEGDDKVWLEVIVRKFPAINLDVPLSKVEQLSLHDLCKSVVFRHPGI